MKDLILKILKDRRNKYNSEYKQPNKLDKVGTEDRKLQLKLIIDELDYLKNRFEDLFNKL